MSRLLWTFHRTYFCLISCKLFRPCSEDSILHIHMGLSVSAQLPHSWDPHSYLPAQHHSEVMGLGSIPSDRKLLHPRKIKAKHNHVGHNFKSPKSDFWNTVLCSEHRSHWLQDAAVKVQHAYKSCTKNKTNVKLLTASEKIGSSDSAIITWELCDRKRDSIQFSRVEHRSLAICSFPKFCLILYTASHFWGQGSRKGSYNVYNCTATISSQNFPYHSQNKPHNLVMKDNLQIHKKYQALNF